jgi:hypothetical protein
MDDESTRSRGVLPGPVDADPRIAGCPGSAAKNSLAKRAMTDTSGRGAIPLGNFSADLPASVVTTVSDDGSLVLMILIHTGPFDHPESILGENG